jgi:hypothetical protein
LLGLGQTTGLVVLGCQIESLLDRQWGRASIAQYPVWVDRSQEMPVRHPCTMYATSGDRPLHRGLISASRYASTRAVAGLSYQSLRGVMPRLEND